MKTCHFCTYTSTGRIYLHYILKFISFIHKSATWNVKNVFTVSHKWCHNAYSLNVWEKHHTRLSQYNDIIESRAFTIKHA